MNKPNLLAFAPESLAAYFSATGERPFRATQVIKWVHQRGVGTFSQMTDVSKSLRQKLQEDMVIEPPEVQLDRLSSDGTRKWLLRLKDGNCIETVFIPEPKRRTLCISSQVGCALKCSFCHTAQQGFNRNLTVDEIVGQLWLANHLLREAGQDTVSNVVLMGMGEPLLNFDNVVSAITLMLDDNAYGLSKRRVTLSTSGIVPALDELGQILPVSLAVSLHAPDDSLRDELVPVNKKYPIELLLQACRRYAQIGTRRHVTFEYVMLDGVNDTEQHARRLVRLLSILPAKVNLIPFNIFPGTAYSSSSMETIERFRSVLVGKGLVTTIRKTRGDDIVAACGQLAGSVKPRERRAAGPKRPQQPQGAHDA